MEAVGAERCGGGVKEFQVEFLSSENAPLTATAKVIVGGSRSVEKDAVSLSMDGKTCSEARCGFEAKKGQTYRLMAASGLRKIEDLCIVVARP